MGDRASNVGARLATNTAAVAPGEGLERPLQPVGMKTPASPPRVGFARGASAEGGPYLDTAIGRSSPQIFEGRTADGEEMLRNRRRFKYIMQVVFALSLSENPEEKAHAKALLACGRYFRKLHFPCGEVKLAPCKCDSPFCPNCSAERAKPLQTKIWERIDQSSCDYWHFTLTVKNQKQISRGSNDDLIRKFRALRNSRVWREQVSGGVYSLEATYSSEGSGWHPHFHCLIETKKRLPLDWIFRVRRLWKAITGDSHVIHLERLYSISGRGRKLRRFNRSALKELLKYSTKVADFSDQPAKVLEFYRAFRHQKRVECFGSFRGVIGQIKLESAEKKSELAGCACGSCKWKDARAGFELIHISQTEFDLNGIRQLRLFDSGHDPPGSPLPETINEEIPAVIAFQQTLWAVQLSL